LINRREFENPISGHQAIKFMLGNMALKVKELQLLVFKAACLLDEGKPNRDFQHVQKHLLQISLWK